MRCTDGALCLWKLIKTNGYKWLEAWLIMKGHCSHSLETLIFLFLYLFGNLWYSYAMFYLARRFDWVATGQVGIKILPYLKWWKIVKLLCDVSKILRPWSTECTECSSFKMLPDGWKISKVCVLKPVNICTASQNTPHCSWTFSTIFLFYAAACGLETQCTIRISALVFVQNVWTPLVSMLFL